MLGETRSHSRIEIFPSVRWLPAVNLNRADGADDAALQRICRLRQMKEALSEGGAEGGSLCAGDNNQGF